jgi:hypothetical protein
MTRFFYLCLFGATAVWGQDPAFEKVPFEEWLKEGGGARIQWSMRVMPARLTVQQRLSVAVWAEIDGAEFVKRNKPGQVVVYVEIRDHVNRTYRSHRALNFQELKKPDGLAAVTLQMSAFVRPGSYEVAAAVYDAESKEHSLKRAKLRVAELAHDPLPGMWRDLPNVEFSESASGAERWYLPEISSRLHLPVVTERRVRVEVVVNESASETALGRSGRASRRNMGNLIPALKVISQMELRDGAMNVALLDLERRKVSFTQENAGTLDWTRLRAALLENDPDRIDVHALENHEQNAQFFVGEIRKRLEARAVIVLSGPMAFPKGEDLRPIEAVEGASRVFYIRYYPPRAGVPLGPPPDVFGRRGRGIPSGGVPGPAIVDSLEATLKPLGPRVFDVTTPQEFRSALAAIMSEIAQLK